MYLLHDKTLVDAISNEINRINMLDLNPHLKWEYIKASIKDLGRFYAKWWRKKTEDTKIIIRANKTY